MVVCVCFGSSNCSRVLPRVCTLRQDEWHGYCECLTDCGRAGRFAMAVALHQMYEVCSSSLISGAVWRFPN